MSSSFGTIEALSDSLAYHLLISSPLYSASATLAGHTQAPGIHLTLRKPSALPFAIPSVSIRRWLSDYAVREAQSHVQDDRLMDIDVREVERSGSSSISPLREIQHPLPSATAIDGVTGMDSIGTSKSSGDLRVFIALGSNIGDRIGHIKTAVKVLQAEGCVLQDCSRLYESEPMYVEDQDRFINGVIEVRIR